MFSELNQMLIGFNKRISEISNNIDDHFTILSIIGDAQKKKQSTLYKLRNQEIDKLLHNQNIQKRLLYNSVIISLYGYFEKTIKDIIVWYINTVIKNELADEELSKKIKKKNYVDTLTYLSRNGSYDELTDEEKNKYLTKLQEFNVQGKLNSINSDLFVKSRSNLYTKVVGEMAANVGIQNLLETIKSSYAFISSVQYAKGLNSYEEAQNNINRSIDSFSDINDIVWSRNVIAHEGEESNMISLENLLKIHIPVMVVFMESFVDIVAGSVMLLMKDKAKLLELNIIKIIGSKIICFNCGTNKVRLNDRILVIDSSQKAFAKIILKIQKNGVDIIESIDNENIGVELSRNCAENYKYFAIKKE